MYLTLIAFRTILITELVQINSGPKILSSVFFVLTLNVADQPIISTAEKLKLSYLQTVTLQVQALSF